ncbi:MAG: aldose epimerase family protein [Planctomycetota bacterium]
MTNLRLSAVAWMRAAAAMGAGLAGAVVAFPAPAQKRPMPAEAAAPAAVPTSRPFGTLPDGREARLYTLQVPGGWKATITDYGAILTSFIVPPAAGDLAGKPVDVVLGFDSLAGYLAGHPYFGAICGRCSNRIAAGRFDLAGETHVLATNNGANHLHGGVEGFDKKLWKATPRSTASGPAVEFELVSPAGEEGYPGRLVAKSVYTLTPAGELLVEMTATSDAPTLVNLVHHSYWNLAGQAAGSIKDHELAVEADRYLPVDAGGIPTGAWAAVEGTSFDFRPERKPWARCGGAIETLPPNAPPGAPRGVDHAYVLRGWKPDGVLRTAAVLRDPGSGRALEILTDQPSIQVYMGNFLDGSLTGKADAIYGPNAAICLETQKFPDSIHHADWPSVRLEPGQTYRHVMVHRFTR